MSGRSLVGADEDSVPWRGGAVSDVAHCVLAPNPSPWTLEGTNTWIIGGADELCVVVDPGPLENGHREAIESQLEARNQRIGSLVLTHGHVDHAAGALELAQRHRVDVRAWDPRVAHLSSHRGDTAVLSADEIIEAGGVDMRVLPTPGHSSDSVSLLVGSSILTGDTVLGRGTTLVAHPDGRLDEYLRSLTMLSKVCQESGTQYLLPGHGPVLDEPGRVVEYYLDHRRERLDQVRQAASGGAHSARKIVEMVYADVPREVWPAAEATVLAQLHYLGLEPD